MDRYEAIERIKARFDKWALDNEDMKAIQNLIPELRESEDERIMEAIEGAIRVYEKTQGEWIAGYDMDTLVVHLRNAFASLEKQKALSELGKYIATERTKPGFMFAGNDSVSWEELPLDVRKHDYPYYFIGDLDCYPFDVEKQKEQHHEWSLQDEKNLDEIFCAIRIDSALSEKKQDELISWLQQYRPYMHKERGPLTKEEEYTLQRIIEYLEDETCPPEWISLLHDIYCLPYEKQKEQKPAELSEDTAPVRFEEENGEKYPVVDYKLIGRKPVEWNEEDREMKMKILKYLSTRCNVFEYEEVENWFKSLPERFNLQPKQEWSEDIIRKAVKEVGLTQYQIDWFKTNVFPPKSEWSEEDEKIYKTIYSHFTSYNQYVCSNGVTKEDVIRFLESLRLQPKPEWNKKDKKIVRALRHALNCADAQNAIVKSGVEVSEVATFLQDLVPSWKPSEEQLEAARYVSQFDYGGHKAALVSLYEQLKAL